MENVKKFLELADSLEDSGSFIAVEISKKGVVGYSCSIRGSIGIIAYGLGATADEACKEALEYV